jgi:hypothetical protein
MAQAKLGSSVRLLGAAAILTAGLAFLAVHFTQDARTRPFTPEPYFPQLETKISRLTRIEIQTKDKSAVLAFAPDTGWTVPTKDGYRARFDEIQRLVLALVDLQRFERKTKEPKWQKRLLLINPHDKGAATLVRLLDATGGVIAALLIGLNADVDNVDDKAVVYVRAPGDNQVWLARGAGISALSANSDDWLDKRIIDVPKERLSRIDVKPADAPPYALIKEKTTDTAFVVEGASAVELMEASVNGLTDGLADLRLRDVARLDRITFTEMSPAATFRTTDGLMVRVEIAKLGEDYWVRLTPSLGEAASAKAIAEADSLKRLLTPWVFEIERFKGTGLTASLVSLREGAPATEPGATPENPAPTAPSPAPAPAAPAPEHPTTDQSTSKAPVTKSAPTVSLHQASHKTAPKPSPKRKPVKPKPSNPHR